MDRVVFLGMKEGRARQFSRSRDPPRWSLPLVPPHRTTTISSPPHLNSLWLAFCSITLGCHVENVRGPQRYGKPLVENPRKNCTILFISFWCKRGSGKRTVMMAHILFRAAGNLAGSSQQHSNKTTRNGHKNASSNPDSKALPPNL